MKMGRDLIQILEAPKLSSSAISPHSGGFKLTKKFQITMYDDAFVQLIAHAADI